MGSQTWLVSGLAAPKSVVRNCRIPDCRIPDSSSRIPGQVRALAAPKSVARECRIPCCRIPDCSLNNVYVRGSSILFLGQVSALPAPKSVAGDCRIPDCRIPYCSSRIPGWGWPGVPQVDQKQGPGGFYIYICFLRVISI